MTIRQAKKVGRKHEELGVFVNRLGTVVRAIEVLDRARRHGRGHRWLNWTVRDLRRRGRGE